MSYEKSKRLDPYRKMCGSAFTKIGSFPNNRDEGLKTGAIVCRAVPVTHLQVNFDNLTMFCYLEFRQNCEKELATCGKAAFVN